MLTDREWWRRHRRLQSVERAISKTAETVSDVIAVVRPRELLRRELYADGRCWASASAIGRSGWADRQAWTTP